MIILMLFSVLCMGFTLGVFYMAYLNKKAKNLKEECQKQIAEAIEIRQKNEDMINLLDAWVAAGRPMSFLMRVDKV